MTGKPRAVQAVDAEHGVLRDDAHQAAEAVGEGGGD